MASKTLFLTSSINVTAAAVAKKVFMRAKNKKLVFIPTAAEGEDWDKSWLDDDRQGLVDAGFDVVDFSITDQNEKAIAQALQGAGTVFVSGGDTYYLLDQARKSGFDRVIKLLVEQGLIYTSSSAGSILAGPSIETSLDDASKYPDMHDYTGLCLTDVSVRPHWGSEHFKERYTHEVQRLYELDQKMILLRDNQYLFVQDDWYQVMSV